MYKNFLYEIRLNLFKFVSDSILNKNISKVN